MKITSKLLTCLLAAVFFAGCSTIYFENGSKEHVDLSNAEWHHDGVFGFMEFSPPVDMNNRCQGKHFEAVEVRQSFLDGLISGGTDRIYDPWEVSYLCAGK